MFRFSAHPAAINITAGIGDAWNLLRASWRRWLPAVLVLAAVEFLVYLLYVPDYNTLFTYDRYGRTVWSPDAVEKILPLVAGVVVIGLLGVVVSWIFYAIAIGSLRNRPMAFSQIVVRGLLALLSSLVVVLLMAACLIPLAVLMVVAPPLGILVAIVGLIYLEIRLIFSPLAIFDGFGPIEGLRESWRLSRGSVVRLFGWGLMALLITWAFSIAGSFVALPFGSMGAKAAGSAASSAVGTIASCFTVFLMAVLYESQRARLDPTLYPYTPMPYYPMPYAPGPYPPGPYPPGPYPPPPYAAGPYAPAPYPGGPYAPGPYPPGQWAPPPYAPTPVWPPNRGVPPTWPPYQTGAPGWPANQYPAPTWQTDPSAGSTWVSNEPDAPPAADAPKPPEPPASS